MVVHVSDGNNHWRKSPRWNLEMPLTPADQRQESADVNFELGNGQVNDGSMSPVKTPVKTIVLRACAGASILLLGLGQTGCSTTSETAPHSTNITAPAPSETTSAPTTATGSSVAAPERHIALSVTGAKESAQVKVLVVTSDGKQSGGDMKPQTLPFTHELTIPSGTNFTKILVLGKYTNGATGEISCSVTIDGKVVSTNTSTSHKPAECLVLENGGKS